MGIGPRMLLVVFSPLDRRKRKEKKKTVVFRRTGSLFEFWLKQPLSCWESNLTDLEKLWKLWRNRRIALLHFLEDPNLPFPFFFSSVIHQFNPGDNNLCDLHEEVKTEAWAIGIIEKGVTLLDVEPQFS
jgi:hypothetical protein